MAAKRAVFIDKDGTLIPDIPFNVDPELITLSDDTLKGLKDLQNAGYLLFIISNQSGVARGYYSEEGLLAVEAKIQRLLQTGGLYLHGFYHCPHHPDGKVKEYAIDCHCRKPKPGLFLAAAQDHQINLSKSWMIGDILDDVEAGHRAGCHAVLVNNGNETEWEMNELRVPDLMVKTVNEAAAHILNHKVSYFNNEGISATHRKV